MKRYLLVADIEATCTDSEEFPREEMEMIQFGAVIVDMRTYDIIDKIDVYVRPILHTKMTSFCVELTGITDQILDEKAVSLGEFCILVNKKLKKYKHQFEWAAWGAFDKRFLDNNLERRGLSDMNPFKNIKYTNLSMEFMKVQGLKRKKGVKKAMAICGLQFSGRQHNGYDDAKNTSKMLPYILPKRAR